MKWTNLAKNLPVFYLYKKLYGSAYSDEANEKNELLFHQSVLQNLGYLEIRKTPFIQLKSRAMVGTSVFVHFPIKIALLPLEE